MTPEIHGADLHHRVILSRSWPTLTPPTTGPVLWVGLNPSTADDDHDDATVRRLIAFSKAWGACELRLVNLYSIRATDPREMWALPEPLRVSVHHWPRLRAEALMARHFDAPVILCWGDFSKARTAERAEARRHAAEVVAMFQAQGCNLRHLGLSASGQPRHPLYLPGDTQPQEFPEGWTP